MDQYTIGRSQYGSVLQYVPEVSGLNMSQQDAYDQHYSFQLLFFLSHPPMEQLTVIVISIGKLESNEKDF